MREIRRPSLFAANGLFLLSLAGLFAISFLQGPLVGALAALFPGIGWEALRLSVYSAYYLLFNFVPTALVLRKIGAWESARVKPISAGKMLAVAAVALLSVVVVLQVNSLWVVALEALHIPFYNPPVEVPGTTAGMVVEVFSMGVLPGVCEEFLFRGAILGAYERRGTKKAIVASAVLFSLVHGSVGGIPAQLMGGAIMGFLAFSCDSIYAPIAYHTVHNTALLFIAALGERLSDQAAEAGTATAFEQIGGVGGILQALASAAAFGAALLFALRAFNRRRIALGVAAVPARRERMSGGARALLVAAILLVALLYAISTLAA